MKLNCNIVRDLLPVYRKRLTSDETEKEIREHLAECEGCKEVYENRSCGINDKKFPVNRKIVSGIAVLLFILLRFVSTYGGTSNMLQYETEFYILLASAAIWYVCKDLFRTEIKQDKTVLLLHLGIFLITAAAAIWFILMIQMTEADLKLLGVQAGKLMKLMLQVMIAGTILLALCGLYGSIMKSVNYFGLVCHGLGSLLLLVDCWLFLTQINLPLHYSAGQQLELFQSLLRPYMAGIVLTVLYYLYQRKKGRMAVKSSMSN